MEVNKPENNCRAPANLAVLELSISEIQQENAAVIPTMRDNVLPIPVKMVVALHHPEGIVQKL